MEILNKRPKYLPLLLSYRLFYISQGESVLRTDIAKSSSRWLLSYSCHGFCVTPVYELTAVAFMFSDASICPPPLIEVSLGRTLSKAVVVKPSQRSFTIAHTVINRCNTTRTPLRCNWQQAEVSERLGLVQLFLPVQTRRRGEISSFGILLTGGGGYYLFRCTVGLPGSNGTTADEFVFVHILRPRPVAVINGPHAAFWKSKVVLNATGSYDAVEREKGPTYLRFRWYSRCAGDDKWHSGIAGQCFGARGLGNSHVLRGVLVLDTAFMEKNATHLFKVKVSRLRVTNSVTHRLKLEAFASIRYVLFQA